MTDLPKIQREIVRAMRRHSLVRSPYGLTYRISEYRDGVRWETTQHMGASVCRYGLLHIIRHHRLRMLKEMKLEREAGSSSRGGRYEYVAL